MIFQINIVFRQAKVMDKEVTRYFVLFSHGFFSDEVLPEQVTNYDCVHLGAPPFDTPVSVRFPSGKIYNGTYKGPGKISQLIK